MVRKPAQNYFEAEHITLTDNDSLSFLGLPIIYMPSSVKKTVSSLVSAVLPSENKIEQNPLVGIVMGSKSDWPTMIEAARILEKFGIFYEAKVLSAHRMPQEMGAYAQNAEKKGLHVIIAGAGGAAHLPGMLAAQTTVPILAVPVKSKTLNGIDSLLSIVQMPAGIPVATFAIGEAGAKNAALFAVAQLALHDQELAQQLTAFRILQTAKASASKLVLPRKAQKAKW